MEGLLEAPIKEPINDSGENEDLIYSACAVQGWRKRMEDVFMIHLGLGEEKNTYLFGVFDGFSGNEVVNYVKDNFCKTFISLDSFQEKNYSLALKETFLLMDEQLRTEEVQKSLLQKKREKYNKYSKVPLKPSPPEDAENNIEYQLKLIRSMLEPLNLDDYNIAMNSGCTGSVVYIAENEVYAAHVGKSKVIIYSRNKNDIKLEYETTDFVPSLKEEEKRIISEGGNVPEDNKRINGVLKVSRAIGYFEFKSNEWATPEYQMLIAVPHIEKFKLKDIDYISLFTDGLDSKEFKEKINSIFTLTTDGVPLDKFHQDIENSVVGEISEKKIDNMSCIALMIKPHCKVLKKVRRPTKRKTKRSTSLSTTTSISEMVKDKQESQGKKEEENQTTPGEEKKEIHKEKSTKVPVDDIEKCEEDTQENEKEKKDCGNEEKN